MVALCETNSGYNYVDYNEYLDEEIKKANKINKKIEREASKRFRKFERSKK